MDQFTDVRIEEDQPNYTSDSAPTSKNRIGLNKNYLPTQVIYLIISIFLFIIWICCASVTKPTPDGFFLDKKSADFRSAFLFISVVDFLISVIIFLFILLNIVNFKFFSKLPWILIICIIDIFILIPIFILSILSAIAESDLRKISIEDQKYVNYGAFAAAAFFGFLTTLLCVADCVLQIIQIVRYGWSTKIPGI